MNTNQKIMEALEHFGKPIKESFYGGPEKEYFTFNYADDRGTDFGDNAPGTNLAWLQVHYFLPLDRDYLDMKKEIREALFAAGFTYPEITELKEQENNIRHLVYEFEAHYI